MSWWLWGVYRRAERMNIQRLQPLKGESVTKHATICTEEKKKTSRGLIHEEFDLNLLHYDCVRLAVDSQQPQRLTPGLFSPPAEPRRLQNDFIYAAHFTAKGSTKGFYRWHRQKKAGREMQIDLKQENKQIHFISKKRNGFKSSTARPMCSFSDINLSFRQMWLSNRQMRKVMEAVQ